MDKRTRYGKLIGIIIALFLMLPLPVYLMQHGEELSIDSNTQIDESLNTHSVQTAVQAQNDDDNQSILSNQTENPNTTNGTLNPILHQLPQTNSDTTFTIEIPDINLNHPIIPSVDPSDKKEYLPIIEEYIAHGESTAFPTASNGNTYLFAHSRKSSDGTTPSGGWFTRIDELDTGDIIRINYHGRIFTYKVTSTAIIDPLDTSVYTGSSIYENHRSLTLQTCYPRGETNLRLMVYAIGE